MLQNSSALEYCTFLNTLCWGRRSISSEVYWRAVGMGYMTNWSFAVWGGGSLCEALCCLCRSLVNLCVCLYCFKLYILDWCLLWNVLLRWRTIGQFYKNIFTVCSRKGRLLGHTSFVRICRLPADGCTVWRKHVAVQ